DCRVALVICDVISFDDDVADTSRREAAAETGIPEDAILLTATHTHTGPLYCGVLRDYLHHRAVERSEDGTDPCEMTDYRRTLTDGIVSAIRNAAADLRPAQLASGTTRETKLSFNRRFHMKNSETVVFNPGVGNPEILRPAGPIDPTVTMILFSDPETKSPFAGFTNFALHLDTTGGTLFSGDYPFYLSESLRKVYGEDFVSVFGTGTCGDINHIDVTAERQRRAPQIGDELAETVLAGHQTLTPIAVPSLRWASRKITVPTQTVTPEEVERSLAMRKEIVDNDGTSTFLERVRATTVLDLSEHFAQGRTELRIQAIAFDSDTAIVAIPGEVFVEHGLAIRAASPFAHTAIVELSDRNISYVPTERAFREGSYETVNSRLAPGGGEQMVESAIATLKSLKTGN
ncbi:MAG: hypothetical protein Q4C47_00660, partial [Planctomycetia bacterium]|nr:hypothetical protein [Planctomycetia bacterium]